MKPLEFLNQVYVVNPRGVDPSLVEAAAGGLRDKVTKQMVRQARPVGDLLLKNPGLATGVAAGGVAAVAVAGLVAANRKVIGEQVRRAWERAPGKASAPGTDGRVYDPWHTDPSRTENGEPETTNEKSLDSCSHEKPPVGDVD